MAARHFNPLFLASLLALLAPVPALEIENLGRLNTSLSEILNLHSFELLAEANGADDHEKLNMTSRLSYGSTHENNIRDCSDLPPNSPSGTYAIQPRGYKVIMVYCEMDESGGGWTVIQRNRQDTDVNWAETWSAYRQGFGNLKGEFWLGNEYIYQIAMQRSYQVKFIIWDASNNKLFADYNMFRLDDESQGYRLRLGAHSGTAEDAMALLNNSIIHDNMKFSTKDRDQDTFSGNCASNSGGGWWYSACYSVLLNFEGPLTWGDSCQANCQASTILIKPLKC
ncbi:fibrinogen-like protein 1-like protein [Myiozetetes cayanensis]|uniref:fibrinogen-like protein 1-like protein n=1 Tax=Myiozetetes cayanensis TaxID=478635 RepID=UPI0021601DCE|nr:fibrinogen-like protein 1-like protein [Myiozetetes cayanensis]